MNPLVTPTMETSATMQGFPPPYWLKHQPVFMMPYAPFDGPYRANSDAKYLSVGRAQWRNSNDPNALSAKVWRNPDDKWSRQSEELPLHRVADLCIFMVKTLYQNHETNAFYPTVTIAAGTFDGQQETTTLRRMHDGPLTGLDGTNELVKARLRKLRDELIAADID